MFSALFHITLRQWQQHLLRLALTTSGIALGVAVFFGIRTANATLLDSLRLTVEKVAGKATLQVTAGESGFPEEILDKVRTTPGVQLAEPVIEVIAHTSFADEGNLLVLGVDTAGDQQLRDYQFDRSQTQVADPLVFLAQPNSILVSRAFAERHGLKPGSPMILFTSIGKKDFVVQGVFQPTGMGEVFGGNIAVMDVYAAQVVFNRGHSLDRIDVMNSPGVSVEAVQQRLRTELPSGLEVLRPEARGQTLENTVTAMRLGMLTTSFVALLVGIYIIFNSFSISVNQRWKEIGILRAVGAERRNVIWMFLGEALLLGAAGALLGIAGGFYIAAAASKVMGEIAASVYGSVSTPRPAVFRFDYALTSFALGLCASLLGAWFPARAASRLDPILALHNIETRGKETVLGTARIVTGVFLIGISIALVFWSPTRVGMTLQLFYAVVTLLGLTILLPKLVQWSARALRPLMDWAGGSEGALAVDAMIQSPRRSAATVGALMVGLMFVFSTGAYIQSYRRMIDRWMDQMINADIFVATSAMLRSTTYHFSEATGQEIAALPEVKRLENVRFTSIPFHGDSSALIAIEMDGFLARAGDAFDGANRKTLLDLLPKGKGALVSRNFSLRWGIRAGDPLKLDTPTGPLELPVLALVDDYRSEKGTIFLDRALYKRYWGDSAVDFFDISLKPGADRAAAKRDIERLTSSTIHAFVYTNAEFKKWVSSLVDQFFLLNYMQLVVAVLVSMLGIVNTLIISVSERGREIGIIRSLGGLRSQIRKMVLLEALAIAIIGVSIGALAGVLSTQFMAHTVSLVLAGYEVPFYFPWMLILSSLPVVAVGSVLAGWWPAQRAARRRVIEAIGYE